MASEPEFSLHPRRSGIDGPVWRSNPHNPTGSLAAPDVHADVWDEAFFPLAAGRWTRGDAGSVVVGSLTKVFACPGLRVGYVLADDVDRFARRAAGMAGEQPGAGRCCPNCSAAADLVAWCGAIAARRAELVGVLRAHGYEPQPSDAPWVLVDAPGLRARLAPRGIIVRDCAQLRAAHHGAHRGSRRSRSRTTRPGAAVPDDMITTGGGDPDEAVRAALTADGGAYRAASALVAPVDTAAAAGAREHHDRLTKPRRLARSPREPRRAAVGDQRHRPTASALAGGGRGVRRRPRRGGRGRDPVAAGGHRPDGGQHRGRRGRHQRPGPPGRSHRHRRRRGRGHRPHGARAHRIRRAAVATGPCRHREPGHRAGDVRGGRGVGPRRGRADRRRAGGRRREGAHHR